VILIPTITRDLTRSLEYHKISLSNIYYHQNSISMPSNRNFYCCVWMPRIIDKEAHLGYWHCKLSNFKVIIAKSLVWKTFLNFNVVLPATISCTNPLDVARFGIARILIPTITRDFTRIQQNIPI
jgi:hypothetical protein